ncbi:MAG: hypothetical protein QXO60_02850 [Candidatus Micrarchaeia archaeon]
MEGKSRMIEGKTIDKKMRIGIFMLLVALLSLIFLYGCIEKNVETGPIIKKNETNLNQTNQTLPGNETNQTIPKKCEDLLFGKEKCIIERAYNNNDIEDCEILSKEEFDQKYYVECISKLSEYNYSYCNKLNGSEKDLCFRNAAAKFGDSACNMIQNSTLRNDCLLRDYAEECKKLNDSYLLNICNAIAKSDASLCEKMATQLQKDECYLNYSISLSENRCEMISNLGIKTACESIIYKNVQCGTIENTQIKDYCYQYYSIYTSSCSWCNVISGINYKDDCYQKCAIRAGDMNFCKELSTEQKRDSCYWDYAITSKNVDGCDKIKTIMLKKVCVQNVAKANAMPSECEILLNTSSLTRKDVSDCYLQVIAGSKVSFENCLRMNDGYYKDQCIYMAIKREQLATDYCAYIIDNSLRNECMKE